MTIKKITIYISLFAIIFASRLFCFDFQIARLKYSGGGDWYNGKTALPNLLKAVHKELNVTTPNSEAVVTINSPELFRYPFLFATGHGGFYLTDNEVSILRKYLIGGGFLWVNDSYGLDSSFRKTIKKVFPTEKLVELPKNHEIFRTYYKLKGLPKIHEHNGKRPQLFAIIYKKRIVVLYDYESDIGDGLEDIGTYNDPAYKHDLAIKMGVNIVKYFFTH